MPDYVPPTHAGLGLWDYVAVVVFIGGVLALALKLAPSQHSTDDFFLGGRRMPWLAVGLSMIATTLSTITYLGAPGEFIAHGIGMLTAQLAQPLNFLVIFWIVVPFLMRLRLTTAYEYLELRFDYRVRLTGALLFVLIRFAWMGVVVYASSLAIHEMINDDRIKIEYVIAGLGIFATVYTAVGGIRAVIWTDVIQFLVLMLGAVATIGYVAYATGTGPVGWWETITTSDRPHGELPLFSLDVFEKRTIATWVLHAFFWTVCTYASDQVVIQRYFSTPDAKAARRSYAISAVSDISMACLLCLGGLALLAFYLTFPANLPEGVEPTREFADRMFPHFIAHQLPPGVGGCILAALLAAAMSSIDSGVNAVTAVLTTDFVRRKSTQAQDAGGLRRARGLTLLIGAAATAAAYWAYWMAQARTNVNIVELMSQTFNMFVGPLAVLFFVGMFLRRADGRAAILTVLASMAASVVWNHWIRLFDTDNSPTFTLAIAVPCVTGLITAVLASRANSRIVQLFVAAGIATLFAWHYTRPLVDYERAAVIGLAIIVPVLSAFSLALLLQAIRGTPDAPRTQWTWREVMRRT